ncbi:MAG: hypothetical protein L0229_06010, partial [Blastocatellia bacterium]|nr:hypothetical protein [Blastocatellia bacterium]
YDNLICVEVEASRPGSGLTGIPCDIEPGIRKSVSTVLEQRGRVIPSPTVTGLKQLQLGRSTQSQDE